MGLPGTVEFGRNFAVMVRVQGPDPKGLKMRKHAFHIYNSGKTTLSASGMLLPNNLLDASVAEKCENANLVVTVASVVEHFLSAKHIQGISQGQPELIPGVQIDIMVEGETMENNPKDSEKLAHSWIPAKLLALIDLPLSAHTLQSLVDGSSNSAENGWEFGWSLASDDCAPQHVADVGRMKVEHDARASMNNKMHMAVRDSINPSLIGKSITKIAVLAVSSLISMDLPDIAISHSDKKGDLLLALGSPFGVLSPVHFLNSIAKGSIANIYPPSSTSLLMADMRSLPGMEGGPVFNEQAHLVGILTRPLRQKISGAEIQLVIPWKAIATAFRDLLRKDPQNARKGIEDKECITHPPSFVDKAVSSVCLITVNDGTWASGVLLNEKGLILTNAHLLEPWRFGKTAANGRKDESISESSFITSEKFAPPCCERVRLRQEQGFLPKILCTAESFSSDEQFRHRFTLNYKGYGSIRVRLDHKDPSIWCDARVVYISRGPLDVALLQLEFVPDDLCPIGVDFVCPPPGSKAYVIGHGLFGPRSDSLPSVSHGVVAKVVKAKLPKSDHTNVQENTLGDYPAMLETTASVHPGGSGGAVVNSDGRMIGLVTSNARHGGGTVIPHLNFSILCAALTPIFRFSKDEQDLSILHDLDRPNKHLSSVWALMPPLSPEPDPVPILPKLSPEHNEKEVKGSRFAKFISERQRVFKNSTQQGEMEMVSNENIRSKL